MRNVKYMTEFGLHVVGDRKALIPVEYLKELDIEGDYKVYAILSAPEIHYRSHIVEKKSIKIKVFRIIEEEEEVFNFDVNLYNGLDHTKLVIKCVFPFNYISFEIEDEDFLGKHKLSERVENFEVGELFQKFSPRLVSKLDYEVLYVGQSQGKKVKSDAFKRLSSHSTLQKILSDYQSKDKKIWVLLIELNINLNMIIDGHSKNRVEDEEIDKQHMTDVLDNLPEIEQVINITEASMINYFKPYYNTNFVENFPDKKHMGYTQYYRLDYNSLTVELGLEFEHLPAIRLFTQHNEIASLFHFIEYQLHNDQNRKSMYDIFKKKDGESTSIRLDSYKSNKVETVISKKEKKECNTLNILKSRKRNNKKKRRKSKFRKKYGRPQGLYKYKR